MKNSISLAVLFVAVSCANPAPAAAPAQPAPAAAQPAPAPAQPTAAQPAPAQPAPAMEGPRAPLIVVWSQKELATHSVTLDARVEYRGPFTLPVHLTVKVPAGARLVSGPAELDLAAQPTATTISTEYKLSFTTVPAGDLVLVADAHGAASGVHAENTYRFGRPAPSVAGPKATGPEMILGGHDLGKAIQVTPPPTK